MKFCFGYRHQRQTDGECWLEKLGRPQICAAINLTNDEISGPFKSLLMSGQERIWGCYVQLPFSQSLKWVLHRVHGRQRWSVGHRDRSSYFQTLRQLQKLCTTLPDWSQLMRPVLLSPTVLWAFLFSKGPIFILLFEPSMILMSGKMVWSLN